MGIATCEVKQGFLDLLKTKYASYLDILEVSREFDDGFYFIKVSSPLIPDDTEGCQEICVVGDGLKFKPWRDV
jgi:hypothetical protein